MDLNESLFSRVKHKVSKPLLLRSMSDSGPEEARDADGESSECLTPRGASYESLLIPETPSPVLQQRIKNKREREIHSSPEEDSDSKRSRAMKNSFDRFVSPFKTADIKNKERKEAFEKLRLAREKRLAKIESDSDDEKATTNSATNGYKYSHFGTGYLGWPSESDSESEDNDDNVPLRSILEDKKVSSSEMEKPDNQRSNSPIFKRSIIRQMKEAVVPNQTDSMAVASSSKVIDEGEAIKVKTEFPLEGETNQASNRQNLPEFVSPKAEYKERNTTMKLESGVKSEDGKSICEESKHIQQGMNRRRNLFSKEGHKVKNRPSLFDNCNDLPQTSNPHQSISQHHHRHHHHPLHQEESRPACRFAQNMSFRPASSLLTDRADNSRTMRQESPSSSSDNIICSPAVHRGDNSGTQVCRLEESSFLNQLPTGKKPAIQDRAEQSNIRRNGEYGNHYPFSFPQRQGSFSQNGEFATPPHARSNMTHTIDLTRSESPTFCSPRSHLHSVNGIRSDCRFQNPAHDISHRDTNRSEITHPVSFNLTGGSQRPPSPDVIPLGVFNLSANRRPEFDLSLSPQPLRNRSGSRRHNRGPGMRRNRIGNVSTEEGISPTTTRLMSEVSVSSQGNDADEAVSMVRQLEDDEQYARRLQEEMDKEFALSLHQADAGFVQSDHAGAFGAEEAAACPPALSPSFLQYCRSPVRRRGYNSNRQPINRRRRGAAAAEPEDLSNYEELIVDGPGYEHGARRNPPGANHPLALMEAHILALLDNSPVTRRGRRRGNNGGRFLRNLHSPVGDGNDYEELLELAESLGEVKQKGMTKTELSRLVVRKYKCGETSRDDATDCLICMCDYQEGDKLRILPCCHEFHQPCIDKWLKSMATCPICRVDVKNS